MQKIGAHVSSAGGLENSFDNAIKIGANATQIFISPPQMWLQKKYTDEQIAKYSTKQKETGIGPNVIHGAYLINLATDNPVNLEKAISWLIYSQNTAEKLGITGTIFHIGSSKEMDRQEALNQVIKAVSTIMQQTGNVNLILETAAGAGNTIGDEFFELGQIIKSVQDERVKVCLDTQHVYASGYDLATAEGLERAVEEFEKEIGLDKLVVIHANDSKMPLNSHRDRHENIGEGLIGKEGFARIINHPAFKEIPFILEVPGFANEGPDIQNIELLRSLQK